MQDLKVPIYLAPEPEPARRPKRVAVFLCVLAFCAIGSHILGSSKNAYKYEHQLPQLQHPELIWSSVSHILLHVYSEGWL